MPAPATALDRRAFLRTAPTVATGAVAGAGLAGCSTATPRPTSTAPSTQPTETGSTVAGNDVLLAYFSRAGENYHYGGRRSLDVGNTQVVAEMISARIGCDVYRIEAADPYSDDYDDYDDTVARNVREQDADARPAIAQPLPSVEKYDTILLGSPIWNVRAPMITATFVEGVDLSGKTVLPFTTYAMSRLGNAPGDYARVLPTSTIGDGLAVQGEEAGHAQDDVEQWLRAAGLLRD
jgi:flavodoxin